MEQQIDAIYLRPGPISKAFAIGIAAAGIGTGILLATWGISLLWRPILPNVDVRIANPEVRITQDAPLIVKQDAPFVVKKPEPLKIDPAQITVQVDQATGAPHNGLATNGKSSRGDVIQREVTVFSTVKHGAGSVVTGWKYSNGSGGVPSAEYCYYTSPDLYHSSLRIDIAYNRAPLTEAKISLVPDAEGALRKCQWWHA